MAHQYFSGRKLTLAILLLGIFPLYYGMASLPVSSSPLIFSTNIDKTLKGRVTDGDTQTPLPGVSVVVKGTTRGTTTSETGEFQQTVEDNDQTLVFSF